MCADYTQQQQSIPQQQPHQVPTGNAYGASVDAYGGQVMPDNSGGYGQQGGGGVVVAGGGNGGYDDRSAAYGVGKL